MTMDHHGRIWNVEKNGRIYIYENGVRLPDPFLALNVDDYNERGLLGIALHPDFDQHPYVYVYYTVPHDNHNRVSRFRANGDLAVPGSEEILLNLDPLTGAIHNAGAMLFDNAGYLYIATGEGGRATNSQDTTNLLGKILRLHDDGSIPEDNPFYQSFEGKNRAIWCMGLRNPFNLTYDVDGDILYATDVGGGAFEEINVIERGKNYGWPDIEGPRTNQVPPESYQDPLYAYNHDVGCAIVGLTLYKPHHIRFDSAFYGALFFGDYCKGFIRYFYPDQPERIFDFADQMDRPLNFLTDEETGDLLFQSRSGIGGGSAEDNTSTQSGEIWRITYTGIGKPNIIRDPKDALVPAGEDVEFEVAVTGSTPFTYMWYKNDSLLNQDSSRLVLEHLTLEDDSSEIWVVVSNPEGSDTSEMAILFVTDNTRPFCQIHIPLASMKYKAGDTIHFSGMATDQENGILPPQAMHWQIEQHHNTHTHPIIELNNESNGYFVIPVEGETDTNVWIRITLTAVDEDGLSGSSYVEIHPRLSTIHFVSDYAGLINVDGAIKKLPSTIYSTVGLKRNIQVIDKLKSGKYLLLFDQWSDGFELPNRMLSASQESTHYSIHYDTLRLGTGNGLFAEYFNDPEFDFDEDPALVRVDTTLSFLWGESSPNEDFIDKDNFTARWRGFIQPIFGETYTLYITSDDGARMWIEDSLIFDHWRPQAPTEYQVDVDFDDRQSKKIKIEYFEKGGGAEMIFRWSSPNQSKEVVPKRQLFQAEFGHIAGTIWLDQNQNDSLDEGEARIQNAHILLLNQKKEIIDLTVSQADGVFDFFDVETGVYYVQVIVPSKYTQVDPGLGLDQQFLSYPIRIDADEMNEIQLGMYPGSLTSQGTQIYRQQVDLFPNPARNRIYIRRPQSLMNQILTIHDIAGQSVKEIAVLGQSLITVDVSDLDPGFYSIVVKDAHQFVPIKLVVAH